MSREDVYQALFGLASSVSLPTGFMAGTSRRLKLWSDVEAFPYLMQVEHEEDIFQTTSLEYRRTLHAEWWVYHKAPEDPDEAPSTFSNLMMDAIEAALAPEDLDSRQTLGGLVHHCWLNGKIIKVPGDLDGSGLLIAPISILVP